MYNQVKSSQVKSSQVIFSDRWQTHMFNVI